MQRNITYCLFFQKMYVIKYLFFCVACEFRCAGGTCIENTRVCNGVPDCSDAADEIGCSKCMLDCHN